MPKVSSKSPLIKMFGESPFIKVVDTLMDHPSYEYTKKELAEVNEISRPTLYGIWDKLERFHIVKLTRKIGNTQLFKLNKKSEIVSYFYKMEEKLRKEIDQQKIPA